MTAVKSKQLPRIVAPASQAFIQDHWLGVTIPFAPPVNVSPNAHVHFSDKAKASKLYRRAAKLMTVNVLNMKRYDAGQPLFSGPLQVKAIIGWGRGRASQPLDADNSVAVLKAALDGVAEALGINDRLFATPEVEQVRDQDGRGWTRIELSKIEERKPVQTQPAVSGRVADVRWDGDPVGGPLSLQLTIVTDNESLVEYLDIEPLTDQAVYTIGDRVSFAPGEYQLLDQTPVHHVSKISER